MKKVIIIVISLVTLLLGSTLVSNARLKKDDMCSLVDDISGGSGGTYGHGTTGYELRSFSAVVTRGGVTYVEYFSCCVRTYNTNRACDSDMEDNVNNMCGTIDREKFMGGGW